MPPIEVHICPLRLPVSSRPMTAATISDPADGDKGETPTSSASTNLSTSHNLQVPAEIVTNIISFVIGEGLRISNSPGYDTDLTTVHSLLKTSKCVRSETLRQISSCPIHFFLTGEKTCNCTFTDSSDGWIPMEFRCKLLPEKVKKLPLPLQKWDGIIVYFIPIPQARLHAQNKHNAQGRDDPHAQDNTDSTEDVQAEVATQAHSDTQMVDGSETDTLTEASSPCSQTQSDLSVASEGFDEGMTAREEFWLRAIRVAHYSTSLSTTLYALYDRRARPTSGLVDWGEDYDLHATQEWARVCGYYDAANPHLPLHVNFVFGTPSPDCLAVGDGDMPLWTFDMINATLRTWSQLIPIVGLEQQIGLPSSIALSPRNTPARYGPFESGERFRRNLSEWWASRSRHSDWYSFLTPALIEDMSYVWYLNPEPLEKPAVKLTVAGHHVLHITIPKAAVGDNSLVRWEGEWVGSDDTETDLDCLYHTAVERKHRLLGRC